MQKNYKFSIVESASEIEQHNIITEENIASYSCNKTDYSGLTVQQETPNYKEVLITKFKDLL